MPGQECGPCGGRATGIPERQGHAVSEEILGFTSVRVGGCLWVCAPAAPRRERLLHPQLPQGQAHPSPDTGSSSL